MFKEINSSEINANPFSLLKDNWALVTAGDSDVFNTMTVSWGAVGELWGKDVATIYIRPQRYTEEFLNSNDHFTISFFNEAMKKQVHSICGSKSGREVDKVKECGITPCFDENAPYFDEAEFVFVCKKLAKSTFDPASFIDEGIDEAWYPNKDYHFVYYGEIEKVLISK